jgi:rhomboid protease GluP
MLVELKHEGRTRRLTYEAFEQQVRDGQVPPDAEIRFDAATGDKFVPLRSLELYRELVHSDQARFSRSLARRSMPWVTALLVGIQLRIYLWTALPDADAWFLERLANWAPAVLELGQVHRLFTYGFLHLGLTHLAFNLLFLAYAGWSLERAMGRMNLLFIYLASVFCGGLLSMAMSPDRPSLGASGGDFGLIAAAVIFGWKYGEIIPKAARKYYGWAILAYLVAALLSGIQSPGVDNWGHLGGLLGGAVMVTLLHPEAIGRYQRHNRIVRRSTTGLAAALCLFMSLLGPHLVPMEQWHYRGLAAARPAYWVEGWTFTGDRGSFSPTRQSTLVIDTTVHGGLVDIEQATDRFLEQVDAGGKQVRILEHNAARFEGWPAVSLRASFDLSGQPHVIEAMLVARGHYLHRVHLHTTERRADRYRVLWRRVLDRVDIEDPLELTQARRKAGEQLTSWKAQADLADALGRAGHPEEAQEAWRKAGDLNPDDPRPVAGLLGLLSSYQIEARAEAVAAALDAFPDDPALRVAAAEVLDGLDRPGEANLILLEGWRRAHGDAHLRKALLLRGLEVPPIPEVEAEAEDASLEPSMP